jgi:hypothetical protein
MGELLRLFLLPLRIDGPFQDRDAVIDRDASLFSGGRDKDRALIETVIDAVVIHEGVVLLKFRDDSLFASVREHVIDSMAAVDGSSGSSRRSEKGIADRSKVLTLGWRSIPIAARFWGIPERRKAPGFVARRQSRPKI